MLYQSISGDADNGTSTFKCEGSTIKILSYSTLYASAPMFLITNIDGSINLNNCQFNYGSSKFLSAGGLQHGEHLAQMVELWL